MTCHRRRCGHSVMVKCHQRSVVTESLPGEHLPPMERGEDGHIPPAMVLADTLYCAPCKILPECTVLVSYRLPCGHIIADKPCSLAFAWASGEIDAPQCEAPVECASPLYVELSRPSPRCPLSVVVFFVHMHFLSSVPPTLMYTSTLSRLPLYFMYTPPRSTDATTLSRYHAMPKTTSSPGSLG